MNSRHSRPWLVLGVGFLTLWAAAPALAGNVEPSFNEDLGLLEACLDNDRQARGRIRKDAGEVREHLNAEPPDVRRAVGALEDWIDGLNRCGEAGSGLDGMDQAILVDTCFDFPERDCQAELREAREALQAGRFSRVAEVLGEHCLVLELEKTEIDTATENKVQAYSLLGRAYLLDPKAEPGLAQEAVSRLIFLDHDFRPEDPLDRQAFLDLVEKEREPYETQKAQGSPTLPDEVRSRICPAVYGAGPGPYVERPWEVGIEGGFFLPDRDVSGKPQDLDQMEPTFGVRVGRVFRRAAQSRPRWGWFADVLFADINTDPDPALEDAETTTLRTGAELLFGSRPSRRSAGSRTDPQWFLSFGAGITEYDLETDPLAVPPVPSVTEERTFASVGFGQRLKLDNRARLRWEVRGDHTLDDDGFGGADIDELRLGLALTWGVGRPFEDDRDHDGVRDDEDRDPADPRVCRDADGDGCDDCSIGVDGFGPLPDFRPDNDGPDNDGDGICDAGDDDDDNDCVTDRNDRDPENPYVCEDRDGDTCDDCTVGVDGFGPRCDGRPDDDGTDTDGDGLCDPGDPDDDNDGVPDPEDPEPLDWDLCGDSDGDGCDDCTVGTDDAGPRSDRLPDDDGCADPCRDYTITLKVQFDTNEFLLKDEYKPELDRFARDMARCSELRFEVAGHTDSRPLPRPGGNRLLSERRAAAVRDYLIERGVRAGRLEAKGYGPDQPLGSNDTAEGLRLNRRVELRRLN